MTDRQTLAVAEAINFAADELPWSNRYAVNLAEAAIAASDAKYVPMLANCLRILASRPIATWHGNEAGGYYAGWDDAEYLVKKTLEQLPKDYKK